MSQQYQIEARSHAIAGLWSHNFWALRHPNGEVMAELHGLATDRVTLRTATIGTSNRHSLRAWHFAVEKHHAEVGVIGYQVTTGYLYQEGQTRKVVLSGDSGNILPRWRAAVKSIGLINDMNLDYPPGGIKVIGNTKNSNSMFTTFGDLMGLSRFSFWGVFEPGIDNPVLHEEIVSALRALFDESLDVPVQPSTPVLSSPVDSLSAANFPLSASGGAPSHLEAGYGQWGLNTHFHGSVSIPFFEYHDMSGIPRRVYAE